MPVLKLNGEEITFELAGDGPPVLLLHSLGTHAGLWSSAMSAMSDEFHLVAMDCRGHGGSSNHGGFTVEAIARDSLALMTALGHERFHAVGCSMGGLFVATLCALAPTRVLSLTLAGAYDTVGAAGPPRIVSTRELLATVSMADYGVRYADETLITTDQGARALVANAIAAMTPQNYLDTLAAILTADISPLIASISVPASVLVGTQDKRTPPAVARRLSCALRSAAYREIDGAGHLAMLDEPAAFNAALRNFLCAQTGA